MTDWNRQKSSERGKWADDYWRALQTLPKHKRDRFSIHDFREIAKPLLDKIECLEAANKVLRERLPIERPDNSEMNVGSND